MAWTVRTLRVGLVGAGLLAVGALAVFIVRGSLRMGSPLKKLAQHLGADIDQESDHFTYSQSLKGKTVYTVRAAREVQHRDGTITLHDVGIELYGRTGDRTDRIRGQQFEFDPKGGVLKAAGEVFIELAPLDSRAGAAGGPVKAQSAEDAARRAIHIKTSGLVFLEKEQSASTNQRVDFATGELNGTAVGASYDSAVGTVILRSAVRVTGVRDARPILLTASRAELDRQSAAPAESSAAAASGHTAQIALLDQARYVTQGEHGEESAAADHAVVRLDDGGTPQHIDAQGHVALGGSGRGTVTSDKLQMDLGPTGQPRSGHLSENVRYLDDEPAGTSQGRADDVLASFDPAGNPRHVVMTGGVMLNEHAGANQRQLQAARVELELGGGGKQPLVVRGGQAFRAADGKPAWLRLVDSSGRTKTANQPTASLTTDIKADHLTGRFAAASTGTQLDGLDGSGATLVERVARAAGGTIQADQTSTGDRLKIDMTPDSAPAAQGRMQLARAEQHGGVRLVRIVFRQGSPPSVEHARGEDEVYDAQADVATLTGAMQLANATSALFADRAELDHGRGVSTATGHVRITYVDPGKADAGGQSASSSAAEPVHVIAARAVLTDATDSAVFYGAQDGALAGSPLKARMWQGNSQIEAPVLELNRERGTLDAHGAAGSAAEATPVRTILVNAQAQQADAPEGARLNPARPVAPIRNAGGKSGQEMGPVRILSQSMIYTEGARQAVFRGHVRVDDNDGTMTADEATAFLTPAAAGNATATATPAAPGVAGVGTSLMNGQLQRVVGIGHVVLRQPQRTGTGDRIVYTAADRIFVLTGSKGAPPKVIDDLHGTVSGATLRFRSGDETVFVDGDPALAERGRVTTDTKIKQ